MHLAPPPNARDLLPPLLACLPTVFAAPRPPPALLPLLAPILRQRVSFLFGNTTDGWLPLLSWDTRRGTNLPKAVEAINLEPHPVSGELELDDVRPAKYRRLDQETLQARLEVEQFGLLPIWVWCEKDEHGGTDPGWKLAELRTLDDAEDGTEWFDTPSEANDAIGARASAAWSDGNACVARNGDARPDDDNDDYWAAYDKSDGGRTPAKRSPAPVPYSNLRVTDRSEADYYARYGKEVQPAMDSHDPEEETEEIGQSSLNGQTNEMSDYFASLQPHTDWKDTQQYDSAHATSNGRSLDQAHDHLSMPRPISPTSSHSSVDRLEERAAEMSSTQISSDHAQLAVKQHVSTQIKSLFRLAKASGMNRAEFEGVVTRELEVLSILDDHN